MYQPVSNTVLAMHSFFKQFPGNLQRSSWAFPDLNRNPLIPKPSTLELCDYLVTRLIKREVFETYTWTYWGKAQEI